MPMRAARSLLALTGKPAAVVDRLPGEHHLAPDARRLRQRRRACSRACTSPARDFAPRAAEPARPRRGGTRPCRWSLPHLDAAQARADRATSSPTSATSPPRPPTRRCRARAIHGDLFRDNVMFVGSDARRRVRLLLRRRRHLLFDIAVALNDWCIDLAIGPPRRRPRRGARRRLRGAAAARQRRAAPAAGADARRGVPLLALAPVGRAPAARRGRPDGARPGSLRARPRAAARSAVAPAAARAESAS